LAGLAIYKPSAVRLASIQQSCSAAEAGRAASTSAVRQLRQRRRRRQQSTHVTVDKLIASREQAGRHHRLGGAVQYSRVDAACSAGSEQSEATSITGVIIQGVACTTLPLMQYRLTVIQVPRVEAGAEEGAF
jgi:hypothetical protein